MTIVGEHKLRIKHSFMCLPDDNWETLTEVNSHPVALAQCREFLIQHPKLKIVETEDTAGSAEAIKRENLKDEKDFDENEFMRSFMERKQISTKKQALAELRKLIKKEGYYQTKIKEALKKRYPDAFVAKISQGAYSQAGIPDVMFIKDGHYFGFEVKRPVVGIRSKLQEQTARMIQAAGGTAAFVCWPEEAIREVEEYEKSQR